MLQELGLTAREQLTLAYRPAFVGREAWLALLEAIRAAVRHLGHKEVAYELDVAGSYLHDALNERDRKRWAHEWTCVLLAMLEQRRDEQADEHARSIVAAQAELTSYVLEERRELTAEDVLAELEKSETGRAAIAAVTTKRGRRR